MSKKMKAIIVACIIIIVAAIFLSDKFLLCKLSYKTEVKLTTIINGLVQFGVIAIIIERFTDKILIKQEYKNFQLARISILHSHGDNRIAMMEKYSDDVDKFKTKFYWINFAIGLLIASIGFRYFDFVIDGYVKCAFEQSDRIFNYCNVFISGVLLAGGSGLVLEIIQWIKDNFKTL